MMNPAFPYASNLDYMKLQREIHIRFHTLSAI